MLLTVAVLYKWKIRKIKNWNSFADNHYEPAQSPVTIYLTEHEVERHESNPFLVPHTMPPPRQGAGVILVSTDQLLATSTYASVALSAVHEQHRLHQDTNTSPVISELNPNQNTSTNNGSSPDPTYADPVLLTSSTNPNPLAADRIVYDDIQGFQNPQV